MPGPLQRALLLAALGGCAVLSMMAGLWLLARKRRDAGVVDPGWAAGLGLLALLYALLGGGDPWRRLLVAVLGGGWALRLAIHLLVRMAGKPEEGRYAALRREWAAAGHDVELRFLLFFLAQGALDLLLSVPFLVAAVNPRPGLAPVEGAGALLVLVAVTGEEIADAQLERWKSDPERRGTVCDAGLWSWSRHPNYFFEALAWCAFALFALGSPWGFLALACPALMIFFLLRVTGIPATEAQAIRSKGEAYREYQRRTSALIPWPPRRVDLPGGRRP